MTNHVTATGDDKACTKPQPLEQRLACIADAGPQAIEDRLAELEGEWSAGRATKVLIGVLLIAGFALTALLNPWWLILPAVGGLFLLQYCFSRTSWLGKMFQAIGFRTSSEIDQEKMALKVLRGDFRSLPTVLDVEKPEDISRLEGEGGITVEPDESKVDPATAAKAVVEKVVVEPARS
jgi:hypothetical protein